MKKSSSYSLVFTWPVDTDSTISSHERNGILFQHVYIFCETQGYRQYGE